MASFMTDVCGLCGTTLAVAGKPKVSCHGLSLGVTVSRGGWGCADTLLQFSDEVCLPCFEIVGRGMAALQASVDEARKRRGEPPGDLP